MVMDQKSFISHVDTTLADLICGCIKTDSRAEELVSNQDQISFSSPKIANIRGSKKLSIFLYNITEDTDSTNMLSPAEGSIKLVLAAPFVLHYLVTAFAGNEKDEHALLEKIIKMFLAKPLIAIVDETDNVELAVKIDSLSLDELSKLWTALDAPLRLCISLAVSCSKSLYNPRIQISNSTAAPLSVVLNPNHVIKLYQVVLKTFNEQSFDWRNRNMFVKQWVTQDFQKNSGMSVEEMQNMLNTLGDKLEHQESSDHFIKPLNQLACYYQHQLDELKGLQKISHKQTENIEAITQWLKDIRALVDGLRI
jgi:hypothetical protein